MFKVSSPSNNPMIINVQTCAICDKLFIFKDICTRSCSHEYHSLCLLVHNFSSGKCKVVGCDEMFNAD
jgi:hypothetical protein